VIDVTVEQLGKFLKSARERKGLSQAQVAQMAGMAQSKLSRIENANNVAMLAPEEIESLARVFEVSPHSLVRIAGYAWDEVAEEDIRAIVYTFVENNKDLTDYQKSVIFAALEDAERRRRELEGSDGRID
jgi:transcriptional regulator with XRE-family HTH domain